SRMPASSPSSATAQTMVGAAQDAFVDGLRLASGVGAAVLLATAAAAWFLLRGQRLQGGIEH
ncbi:MFS transporter, partial [Streptomyces sp. NPDC001193]